MNIKQILKQLLLEFEGRTFYLPKLKQGNRIISLGVSNEQMYKRSGGLNPEDIENQHIMKSIMSGNWKSGVYNMWIREVIGKNFNQVYNTIDDIYDPKTERNRILFYGHHDIIGNIEFVADIESRNIGHMALKIITSAVSLPNRKFFFNKDRDPEVFLTEGKKMKIFHTIVLDN